MPVSPLPPGTEWPPEVQTCTSVEPCSGPDCAFAGEKNIAAQQIAVTTILQACRYLICGATPDRASSLLTESAKCLARDLQDRAPPHADLSRRYASRLELPPSSAPHKTRPCSREEQPYRPLCLEEKSAG